MPFTLSPSPSDGGISDERAHVYSACSQDTRDSSVDRYPLRVHIISAKLEPSVLEDLVYLVENEQSLDLTADPDNAYVIVTAIHTRPRLERHIRWEVAKTKAIVTPDWLSDSVDSGTVQPYGKYIALSDLNLCDEIENSSPKAQTGTVAAFEIVPNHHAQSPIPIDSDSAKGTDLAALNYLSRFSCQRSSPLICPNQALVEELDIIRRARHYEGEERSMLSYARAIASIKAYPYGFNEQSSSEDITKLPYLGKKLTSLVREFIETGKISEAQKIFSSTRFQTLAKFNTIHGIGSHTARHLYTLGLRTIEDLEKYYEVTPGTTHEVIKSHLQEHRGKEIGVERSIQVSLALRHDFSQKIPRREVEEIEQAIMQELELIESGCTSIIVGGYRRGKKESNDVDIVISHPNHAADKVQGFCEKVVQRLHERGLIKHILNMSGHHSQDGFHTHQRNCLEKALTVFVLPHHSAREQMYRRVDLIFATPGIFWTAVVGWTGSTMFERDLRLWAKQKGLTFDSSGITRRQDSKLFLPTSERSVFELLGLTYVPPSSRNADA